MTGTPVHMFIFTRALSLVHLSWFLSTLCLYWNALEGFSALSEMQSRTIKKKPRNRIHLVTLTVCRLAWDYRTKLYLSVSLCATKASRHLTLQTRQCRAHFLSRRWKPRCKAKSWIRPLQMHSNRRLRQRKWQEPGGIAIAVVIVVVANFVDYVNGEKRVIIAWLAALWGEPKNDLFSPNIVQSTRRALRS